MVSSGIFGPKLSGKTTLARQISIEHWKRAKIRTLVLDPHLEDWGKQAMVFGSTDPEEFEKQEEAFWDAVWKSKKSLIIVEEASTTIRRERTLVPVFTRLRHNEHRLIVVGHSGIDLLPVMRQQLDTIYLFRQPPKACQIWAETFCEERLFEAQNLGQFEFLYHRMYGQPIRMKLPAPGAAPVLLSPVKKV